MNTNGVPFLTLKMAGHEDVYDNVENLTLTEIALTARVIERELDRRAEADPCRDCEDFDPVDFPSYAPCVNCLGTQINGYAKAVKPLNKKMSNYNE